MAYVKQLWVNGTGSGTPLNATRLNYMEAGIKDASDRLDDGPNAYAAKAHAAQHAPGGGDPLSSYYAPANPPVFECRLNEGAVALAANTYLFANTGWTITTDNRNGGAYGTGQSTPMRYTTPIAGRYDVEFRVIATATNNCPLEARVYHRSTTDLTNNWVCSDNVLLYNYWYGNGVRARTTMILAANDPIFWWTGAGAGGCTMYGSRGYDEWTKITIRWVGPA